MGKLEAAGIVSVDKQLADNRPRTTFSLTDQGRKRLRHYKGTMLQVLDAFPDSP